MRPLHLTTCDFMVYKDYKIDIRFPFITRIINVRTLDFACAFVCHHSPSTIHYFVIPCQLPYCILQELFHYAISYQLLAAFEVQFCTDRSIYTKDDLFILDNVVFDDFLKFFYRYKILTWNI